MSSIIKRRSSSSRRSGIQFPHTIVDDIMQIYAGYPDYMGTSMYYDIINHQPLEIEEYKDLSLDRQNLIT